MPLPVRSVPREALKSALTHTPSTVVLAVIALAMTAVTLLTAGRAASAERDIQASVEAAGPRLITINVAAPSPGFDHAALERLKHIHGVTWILGLGPAIDVQPAISQLGINVAGRDLATPLPPDVVLSAGRAPRVGEAIVSATTKAQLRLIQPSGAVVRAGTEEPVVGMFRAKAELSGLSRLVLFESKDPGSVSAALVYMLADNADDVSSIVRQTQALSGISDSANVTVQTSPDLIKLGNAVSGQVGLLGRELALSAIIIGLFLISLTVTMSLLSRRRDYGRRRALGATRSALLVLTLAEVSVPVITGALVGTATGVVAAAALTGDVPPVVFCVGAFVLVVVVGIVAAVPSTLAAAWRDPVRTLRVP